MSEPPDNQTPSRFLVGIDLGTTNSALAFVDTRERKWRVDDFPVPQLTAPGTVEARPTLPSFHYQPAAGEMEPSALRLPWSEGPVNHLVGAFARDHGAAAPGRMIASAKSWLSHSGVDRTAPLLPWHGAADADRLSPVEVSCRYLTHLRQAWDHAHPSEPLSRQEVVLAVPASFDEVARELTIEAARQAGLVHLVLVEEPQAAFYAWIAAQGERWEQEVQAGQKILVCDVGGGTTDFTLIRVRPAAGGKVLFHRVAVGEHLMLGGDNLDLAIAHHIEKRLGQALQPRLWGPLVRASRVLKEAILGAHPPGRAAINLSAGGARLIADAIQFDSPAAEIRDLLLEGFLPRVALDDKPAARRSGFQEFGLPYARDPAITRWLAAFLIAHRDSGAAGAEADDTHAARPDMVLFNGGLFESATLRERLIEVLASWFGGEGDWRPRVLQNDRLDLAVARGAAYYAMVRRGHGVRISGGLAHSYYIGVESSGASAAAPAPAGARAVCLAPAGVEEGQAVEVKSLMFELLIRQPVEFPLYASSTRTTDRPGDVVRVDPEQLRALPPIRTVLQSGRKASADAVAVRLHARLTEVGVLDIWCSQIDQDRSWRLQFDVRAAARADMKAHDGAGEAAGVFDQNLLAACQQRIGAAFAHGPSAAPAAARSAFVGPQSLIRQLEEQTAMTRHDWPPTLLRGMWETAAPLEDKRRASDVFESRWLNFVGFCLRPGYGLAVDDWRVGRMWKLFAASVLHPRNEGVRAEWWILWRRLAGGLTAGQQRTIAQSLLADWRTWFRKGGLNVRARSPAFQFGPHESAEVWRLLGSLELLPPTMKEEIGAMVFDRLSRESAPHARDALLFALGRLGARAPMYGPLNALVSPEVAEAWTHRLINSEANDEKATFAVMQLCRRTHDRYRDVSDATRKASLAWLARKSASEHAIRLIAEGGQLQAEEQRDLFGESLPSGLRIE